jgi:ABC-type branched-subunit amino acid transport system ATPase component
MSRLQEWAPWSGITVVMIEHDVKIVMQLVTGVALLQQGNLALSGESDRLAGDRRFVDASLATAPLREPPLS